MDCLRDLFRYILTVGVLRICFISSVHVNDDIKACILSTILRARSGEQSLEGTTTGTVNLCLLPRIPWLHTLLQAFFRSNFLKNWRTSDIETCVVGRCRWDLSLDILSDSWRVIFLEKNKFETHFEGGEGCNQKVLWYRVNHCLCCQHCLKYVLPHPLKSFPPTPRLEEREENLYP